MWKNTVRRGKKEIIPGGFSVILGIAIFIITILVIWMKCTDLAGCWAVIGHNYEQIIEKFGEPDYITEQEDYREIHYDKLQIQIGYEEQSRPTLAIIEDETVRFGIFKIGIGSPRDLVERYYLLKDKMEVEGDKIFGVMEDDQIYTLTFQYDEDDKVEKMYLSFD